MADVLFTRTNNPSSKAIVDGQVIFSTDGDGAIYLDNGNTRLKLGSDEGKVDKTNVLSTVAECVASTNENDVAGASVIKELNTDVIGDIDDKLSVNGHEFIYDYQNGKHGWNESASRGADTFHPFSSGGFLVYVGSASTSGGMSVISLCEQYGIDYKQLHSSDFAYVLSHATVGVDDYVKPTAWSVAQYQAQMVQGEYSYYPSISYNEQTGIVSCNQPNLKRYGGTISWDSSSGALQMHTPVAVGNAVGDIYMKVNLTTEV